MRTFTLWQPWRALTLWQPWASLVAIGAKRFETRVWATRYRGPVLIHAAKREPRRVTGVRFTEAAGQALGVTSFDELPRGAVLAVAELRDVWSSEAVTADRGTSQRELLFGDYGPGRYAWVLDLACVLEDPIPVRGSRGLWIPPPDVVAEAVQAAPR